jgi:peptide/nickel transport system substrate-binding protein
VKKEAVIHGGTNMLSACRRFVGVTTPLLLIGSLFFALVEGDYANGVVFAAAPSTATVSKQASTTDEWVIAASEGISTFDPTISYEAGASLYQHHILDPLVDSEGPDFKIVPKLAESWEIINETTWRFHLRKGVKFHNGQPFDAEDVKYSVEKYQGPKSPRKTEADIIKEVVIINQYTVDVVTKQPYPPLLINIASLLIVPSKLHNKQGAEAFGKNPIGTGPYKVAKWVRDQSLLLEANESYWRGRVLPKKLLVRQINNAPTRVAELVTGGVHIAKNIPLTQVKDAQASGATVLTGKGGVMMLYPLNGSKKPFDDVRVRQAMNYAVDRRSIVKILLEGYGDVFSGFMPNMFGYNPDVKSYAYDPETAKRLLKEAGYPNGFEFTWDITSGVFVKDREVAEYISNQLSKVGIRVNLRVTERNKIQSDFTNGNFEMTSVKWNAGSEPDRYLTWTYYKRSYYQNATAMKLIEQGKVTVDPKKRQKVYQELHKILRDDAVLLFTHAQDDLYGVAKGIDWLPYPVRGSTQQFYFWMVPK